VSTIFVFLTSCTSDAKDDKDVVEGDWRGLSKGVAEFELLVEEVEVRFL
jgi:hypothetical protein